MPSPAVTPLPEGYGTDGITLASNDSQGNRAARQQLVWCVSDADQMAYYPGMSTWCPENIGDDVRAGILASYGADPVLEITPSNTAQVDAENAVVALTTNLLNQPIALDVDNGSVALCEAQDGVQLQNDTLTVTGDADATTSVELCASGPAGDDLTLTATTHVINEASGSWWQSPLTPSDGTACQVYSSINPSRLVPFEAMATVHMPTEQDPTEPVEETPEAPEESPEDPEAPQDAPEVPEEAEQPEEASTEQGDSAELAEEGALAATGSEIPVPLIVGGALLLIAGATFAILARRRQDVDA